jgi:hypothetical protein
MVDSQDDRRRRLRVVRNKLLDKRLGKPIEIGASPARLTTGAGGGTRQVWRGIKRDAFHTPLEQGVMPQTIRIIAICISRRHLIDPLRKAIAEGMVNRGRMARVTDSSGSALRTTHLPVHPTE